MKTTVKDLLHSINIIGEDYDVLIDGMECQMAVVPPVKMTDEGQKYFREALDAVVNVDYKDDIHKETYIEESESAYELLASLAGYCDAKKYDDWFTGSNAEIL